MLEIPNFKSQTTYQTRVSIIQISSVITRSLPKHSFNKQPSLYTPEIVVDFQQMLFHTKNPIIPQNHQFRSEIFKVFHGMNNFTYPCLNLGSQI